MHNTRSRAYQRKFDEIGGGSTPVTTYAWAGTAPLPPAGGEEEEEEVFTALPCPEPAQRNHRGSPPHATRSDPLQIVSIRACLHGRGACADFALKSAALIKTNPAGWSISPCRSASLGEKIGATSH